MARRASDARGKAAEAGKVFVRLKPANPRRGITVQSYFFRHGGVGYKFLAASGWYRVPAGLGQELALHHQDPHDPESPLLFDVAKDVEEAERIEAEELQARERKKSRDERRRDLRSGQRRDLSAADPSDRSPARLEDDDDDEPGERGRFASRDPQVSDVRDEEPIVREAGAAHDGKVLDPDPEGEDLAAHKGEEPERANVGRIRDKPRRGKQA